MNSNLPFHILHQDEQLLIVQTLSCTNSYESTTLSEQMLLENTASFGQFNLGLHVHDTPSKVLQNRCTLLAQLNQIAEGLTEEKDKVQQIHWLNQVHGSDVLDIDELLINNTPSLKLQDADALTTTYHGQALAIMTADCVPIVLYCPDSGRIAGVHAGWHGLAKGVIATTVNQFGNGNTQNHTENSIQAWIGACISVDNYEVSQSVLEDLIAGSLAHFPMLNKPMLEQISKPHNNQNKAWIDLPSLAKKQLESLGVQVMTDDIKNIPCSYADTQYYSHRRATHKKQSSTGRMAMLVVSL